MIACSRATLIAVACPRIGSSQVLITGGESALQGHCALLILLGIAMVVCDTCNVGAPMIMAHCMFAQMTRDLCGTG